MKSNKHSSLSLVSPNDVEHAKEDLQKKNSKVQAFWEANCHQMIETLILNNYEKMSSGTKGIIRYEKIKFNGELCNKLSDVALKSGASLESLLFVAHCKVMSILSGQSTITTGFCLDRNYVSKEDQTSNQNHSLPLAVTLESKDTWNDIALKVHEMIIKLREIKTLTISNLKEINGLFDVKFSYFGHSNTNLTSYQNDENYIDESIDTANLLSMSFKSRPKVNSYNEIEFTIQYRDNQITQKHVKLISEYYLQIIESISENLLTVHTKSNWLFLKDEKQLAQWNETTKKFPIKSNLLQLFEEQVQKTPNQIASISKNEKLTYQQLNERSNQLARYLRELGVGPEFLVGVCMKRSNLMLIGLLGVLKAGGGYVPLDPNYPKERLYYMLNDADVKMILTDSLIKKQVSFDDRKIIQVDVDWEATISKFSCANLECQISSSNVAYLVFTSGSTGFPKAAIIEHKSVIELVYWAKDEFGIDTLSSVLASSSICFDMSIFELYVPLSWGGTVIIVDDILQLPNTEANEKITLLSTVPSALCALSELGWVPTNTKAALLAGEPLSRQITTRIFNSTKIKNIWNAYGLSEDTTYTTTSLIKREQNEAITIGKPIANRQLYVLDEYQQKVPIGVIGELYVAGNGLARGYMNRSELTTERFLPNIFSDDKNLRMYRTGDLVRYRPDGTLEYIARKDHQIKLRGHRIELGEIEMVLENHESIEQCAVTCRTEGDDKRLIAYVVTKEANPNTSPDQLKEYLRKSLPEWMIPSMIVWLKKLPTTSHGKLDRNALPVPEKCPWPVL